MKARLSRRAFGIGVAGALLAREGMAHADPTPVFGLVLHRPADTDDAHPFVHQVTRAIAIARSIYQPLGFDLGVAATLPLDRVNHRIESTGMRDALATLAKPQRINVFLVEALRDAEVKDVYRLGVTWDSRIAPLRRYVILAADAKDSSLAHELGHFFGIPEHSPTKNNLMSYDRDDDLVFLDDGQKARIRAGAARLLASKAQENVAGKI